MDNDYNIRIGNKIYYYTLNFSWKIRPDYNIFSCLFLLTD